MVFFPFPTPHIFETKLLPDGKGETMVKHLRGLTVDSLVTVGLVPSSCQG